ncbi:unnamed protein product [Clavelina lepadiformis]|uniref:Large ribosomal subunit protein mL46 N-terminal domain-containing protein n=1 Tax=Clavelina lepadiformis TaxID=159417 RepID=A0ABP0F9X5_CLALP
MATQLSSRLFHKIKQGGTRWFYSYNRCIVSDKQSLSKHLKREVHDIEQVSSQCPSPWMLQAGVCLIRLPLIEEDLSEFQKRYISLKEQMEYENSILNEWELEKIKQTQLMNDIESGKRDASEMDFKVSKQDYEDDYNQAFKEFTESTTELDLNDADFKNINRRPKDYLVLISKQKLGNDTVWMLPTEEWKEEENLRQSAERALTSHCGTLVDASFVSNAPSGFYKYKFPKNARTDAYVGAKLFIYNAFVPRVSETQSTATFNLDIDLNKMLDYAWVAKDEMRNFLKPKYSKAIDEIIF